MKNYMKRNVLCIREKKIRKISTTRSSFVLDIVLAQPFIESMVDTSYNMPIEEEVHQHGDKSGSSQNREVNMFVLKNFKIQVAYKIWNKDISMIKGKCSN